MRASSSAPYVIEKRRMLSTRIRLLGNALNTPNSLQKRFASGVLWSAASGAIQQLSSLLIAVVTARMLGKEAYGEFSLIQSTIAAWSLFAGFGLAVTATKYVAEYRSGDPEKAGAIVALSEIFSAVFAAAVSALLYITAPSIALHTFGRPEVVTELRIAALILLVASICAAQTGVLSGFESFRLIAKIRVVRGVASLVTCTAGILLGGIRGALWGLVIAWASTAILTELFVRDTCSNRKIRRSYVGAFDHFRLLFRYSIPSVLAGSLMTPATWFASAFVVQQNGGYAQLALFNASNQWRTAIFLLPALAGDMLVPLYSSEASSGDSRMTILKYAMTFGLLTAAPIALIVIFCRHTLMSAFGTAFIDGDSLIPIIAASGVLLAAINPITTLYAGAGLQWLNAGTNLLWSGTLLASTSILVHYETGSRALAYSNLLAYIGQALFVGAYTFRPEGRKLFFRGGTDEQRSTDTEALTVSSCDPPQRKCR